MLYPNFIKDKDKIGVTAPSDGKTNSLDLIRLNNAYNNLRDKGFKIIETKNVRTSINGRSSTAQERAKELEELYLNKNVSLIISASGGDFMLEILPYLNFKIIKSNPKWFQGYSDNTILTFTITTNLDIATIYGENISAFGMTNYHKSLLDNLSILTGNIIKQESYSHYQNNFLEYKTGLENYNLDTPVEWQNLFNEENITIKGRLIGGCLDVLLTLVGTKYDNTLNFIEKYKSDGIIWYLENCDLTNEQLVRGLWQLKEANWFKYTKGIIFGRTLTNKSNYQITYKDSLKAILKDLNIPVIIEADFGHKAPRMTIINGAYTIINSSQGKGTIEYILK
jgi:muramoyltetrapeptide carboxypeptidase LdcA involved in peptidoglycan recycling